MPSPKLEIVTPEITRLVTLYRRRIHQYPEIGYKEFNTQKLIIEELDKLDIKTKKMAGTGVHAIIPGRDKSYNGKVLMLRADMDALPVSEETDFEYKSKNDGVMHACGHDAHVAMLLTLAHLLKASPVDKPVKLCFQPAEEGGLGAQKMIDDGVLENPKVGMAIGLHVWAELPFGTIGIIDGPCMAAVDEFEVRVVGVGGHAAYPHHSIDPVYISAQIITGLQSIVSRNIPPMDPAVVTVASIHAGNTFNIIPTEVVMKGTCRTFSKTARRTIEKRFHEIVTGVARSLGGSAEIDFQHKIPATVNNSKVCDFLREISSDVLGKKNVVQPNPTMGGEDMSLYFEKVPGCFGFLGMRNPKKGSIWPHHHPKFTMDEDVLPIGVEILYRVAKQWSL